MSYYVLTVHLGADDDSEGALEWARYLAAECAYRLDNERDLSQDVPFSIVIRHEP